VNLVPIVQLYTITIVLQLAIYGTIV
jgi:hypothetical protein